MTEYSSLKKVVLFQECSLVIFMQLIAICSPLTSFSSGSRSRFEEFGETCDFQILSPQAETFIKSVCKALMKIANDNFEKKLKAAAGLVGNGECGIWQIKGQLTDYESTRVLAEQSLLKKDYAQKVQVMTKDVEQERMHSV